MPTRYLVKNDPLSVISREYKANFIVFRVKPHGAKADVSAFRAKLYRSNLEKANLAAKLPGVFSA